MGMLSSASKWWNNQRARTQAYINEENRIANTPGTWQNWVWTQVPQPADLFGIAGTPYNLGSLGRKWSGKPQLAHDAGLFRLVYGTSLSAPDNLESEQRLHAVTDDVLWVD